MYDYVHIKVYIMMVLIFEAIFMLRFHFVPFGENIMCY